MQRHRQAVGLAGEDVRFAVLEPGQEGAAGAALAASHADCPAFCSVFPDPDDLALVPRRRTHVAMRRGPELA